MGNPRPTFSIVVCNYNYEAHVQRAIDSALNQTCPAQQVIVVDDGSTDGSWQKIQAYGPRITALRKANEGQISGYNLGFEQVKSDYVIFLDSDDFLSEDCIASLTDMVQPGTTRMHWRMQLVDPQGQPTGGVIPSELFDGRADHVRLAKGLMPASAPGSGNAYSSAMLSTVMPLPLDEIDKHGADFFAIRASTWLGTVQAFEARPLGHYRVHSDDESASLVFGNAAKRRKYTYQDRLNRFKQWFSTRHPELAPQIPAVDIDFSIQKQSFALSIFNSPGYLQGLQAGAAEYQKLIPAIRYRQGSALAKAALLCWATVVLLAPRKLGRPVAAYVCNPASRG